MPDLPIYKTEEILSTLDHGRRMHRFPIFDSDNEWFADARITVYRNSYRWAIVFEELTYASSSPGHWGIGTSIFKYNNGPPVKGPEGFTRIRVTSSGPENPVFLPPLGIEINLSATSIRIRNHVIPLELSPEGLSKKGILMPPDYTLGGQHVLWSLLPENRNLLLASEHEKRDAIPSDLSKFMQLEEWHHPYIMSDRTYPSQSKTFQLLAKAIVAGDISYYRPTVPPNTHWNNWVAKRG